MGKDPAEATGTHGFRSSARPDCGIEVVFVDRLPLRLPNGQRRASTQAADEPAVSQGIRDRSPIVQRDPNDAFRARAFALRHVLHNAGFLRANFGSAVGPGGVDGVLVTFEKQ